MNVFIYGLSFMKIKGKFTGQPIFLKKIMDEFKEKGHQCYYLYRNEITDLATFKELGIDVPMVELKSHVDFQYNEYEKYSDKELNDIINFDVEKFKKTKNKDQTRLFKHNTLRILENLREYDEQFNIDMIVVWGAGYIPRAMSHYAKKNKKKLVVMENGYFRPHTLMVDANGVNFENSVPRTRDFYEDLEMDQDKFNTYLYQPEIAEIDDTLSRKYDDTKPSSTEAPAPVPDPETRPIKGEYVFVPFQLETDSQTISHSRRIKTMRELMLYSLTAVTNYNKANNTKLKVVFKIHPHYKNDGDNFYLEGLREVCKTYGETAVLLEEGDSTQLVRHAKMVITINSTVGIEALMYNRNVVTLGDAFYNIDGIVENVTPYNLITQFKSLVTRKVNTTLIEKFLYFLRFHYFAETYYPDADAQSVKRLVQKMIDINPTYNYKENARYYIDKFQPKETTFSVSHIKFTKVGNITMKVKTNIRDKEKYDQLSFYMENPSTGGFIRLKPKSIDYDKKELTFSILTKQIFFKQESIDDGQWDLFVEEEGVSGRKHLQWKKPNESERNLLINNQVYHCDIRTGKLNLSKVNDMSTIQSLISESVNQWESFSGTYLEMDPTAADAIEEGRLNILYMPWIERSTNGHIKIIDDRTHLNFIPFRYFKNVDDSAYRSKINSYARENRVRLKKHIKAHLAEHYMGVDGVAVTLDWIAPIYIFIEACKELGIPTFLIPHESVFAKMDMYYLDVVTGIDCPVSDYVLAWGNIQKDIFASRGYDESRIINVGTPKFDVNKNYQPAITKEEFFSSIKFDVNKKTMLFVMQPLDSQYHEEDARFAQNKIIKDLVKISESNDYQLILRLPPALGDKLIDKPMLEKLLSMSHVYLEGLDNTPIAPQDSILHADIILSINSTMLFEAALLNQPSLAIKYIDFDLFWEKAGLPAVYSFNELENKITELIHSGENSLTDEGWNWAADQLSDGTFDLNASKKIEEQLQRTLKPVITVE
ncbi:hypothetical protein GLW03_13190 [Halobacillus halophilus]|uniref:capsular polysaccharide export protein, LipB/KpsS family n=1 Tax=Halobacillus halophilus TaxID=1570 RepID=UPI001370048D|nr:hypothetical protein [Halobacillus halophilus]MYL30765.1 hypothetical protein [Halobacillus halophilus]